MADVATYKKVADFGRLLLEKRTLGEGLPMIAEFAKELTGAQRASIFIYNDAKDELWTTLADGVDKIRLASNKGIVGETLRLQKALIVNDVNKDPNFYPEIDRITGYRTYNIITAPIYDSEGECVGVLELLNKDGNFTPQDLKFMKLFAHAISSFVELIRLQEQ